MECIQIQVLLIVLITLAFLPALISLVVTGVMQAESMAVAIIVILLMLVLARRFMQYVLPVAAIAIFLWVSAGFDTRTFGAYLSQFISIGIMLLWFAWVFRNMFRR